MSCVQSNCQWWSPSPQNLGQVLQCCWLGSRPGEITKSRACARQAHRCHACCSVPVLADAGFLLLTGVC